MTNRMSSASIKMARSRALRRQQRCCALCGLPLVNKPGRQNSATLDHIIPSSIGGPNRDWNFQALCLPCNEAKSDNIVIEWDQGEDHGRAEIS